MILSFVAHEARMRQPADKGGKISTRTALEAAAERGVVSAAKALDGPELPEPLEYLWSWFLELDRTRTVGMNGPDPLTYPIIESWARLMHRHPTPSDIDLLLQMDVVLRHPEAFRDPLEGAV